MTHGKVNLDVLGGWSAPARDDAAWEQRATEITAAAIASTGADGLDALMAEPVLAEEEGEPKATNGPANTAPSRSEPHLSLVSGGGAKVGRAVMREGDESRASAGDSTMSDDQNESSGDDNPRPSRAPSTQRPRPSLRAIAERASQAGLSKPPGSMPGSIPPGATTTPLPIGRPSLLTPLPSSVRPSRPAEATADDSGIVDLKMIHATVTAQQKAAADKAKPASEGLFDDDKPEAVAAAASASGPPAAVAAAPAVGAQAAAAPQKKGGGAMAGIVIAVIGLAAAAAIVLGVGSKDAAPPTAPVAMEAAKPTPAEAEKAPEAPAAEAAPAPEAAPAGSAEAVAQNTEGAGAAAPDGALPAGGAEKAAPAAGDAKPGAAAAKPATTGAPGDLAAAMAQATGAEKGAGTAAGAEKAEPAAGGKSGSSSIPEQPPQGSVTSAISSVMGGAKGCVAGAEDVSRATITFGSSGAVSNVSVTGWAAGKPAAGCIKAALKGAKVGPFSKSSFTVGVTIRP